MVRGSDKGGAISPCDSHKTKSSDSVRSLVQVQATHERVSYLGGEWKPHYDYKLEDLRPIHNTYLSTDSSMFGSMYVLRRFPV